MGQTNYTINEYGEIIREDYFFSQVKGTTPQVLPTNRKVWKIWLLSFLTLGIYGVVGQTYERILGCDSSLHYYSRHLRFRLVLQMGK